MISTSHSSGLFQDSYNSLRLSESWVVSETTKNGHRVTEGYMLQKNSASNCLITVSTIKLDRSFWLLLLHIKLRDPALGESKQSDFVATSHTHTPDVFVSSMYVAAPPMVVWVRVVQFKPTAKGVFSTSWSFTFGMSSTRKTNYMRLKRNTLVTAVLLNYRFFPRKKRLFYPHVTNFFVSS